MLDALTQKQRQVLALAILALVVVMIITLAIAPLWAVNRHYMDTIDGLGNRLDILQRTVSSSSGLQSQHEQLKRSLASNRQYLKGTSESLAAANLQAFVKRIAVSKGMDVLSTQILPASEEAGFTRVALKVRTRGMLDNTVKVFHALETGQPSLFLGNITIRSLSRRAKNTATGQMLTVDFDLVGYMFKQS